MVLELMQVDSQEEFSNCYATGHVSATTDSLGGFFSNHNRNIITNCYWDIESSSLNVSDGGEGRSTTEMTFPYSADTYIDWNFDTVWRDDIDFQNNGYPTLK